jgi:hypothetical protein
MLKWLCGIDIFLGLALLLVVAVQITGCTAADVERLKATVDSTGQAIDIVAPIVVASAPIAAVAGSALGVPAWIILILNVLSSTATAIVAGRKKKVE